MSAFVGEGEGWRITCLAPMALQQEYQGYLSKKAQKRQSLIVSLSDENHRQLADIERQREEVEQEFEERKAGKVADVALLCLSAVSTHCTRPSIQS